MNSGFDSICWTIGLFIIYYIIAGFIFIPPSPPIPDIPPPEAILGNPPIPPIPPNPPKPSNPPAGAPPNPAPRPAAPVAPVDYDDPVEDWAPVELPLLDYDLPLTICTVTPSSILYSANVSSSFKIFPKEINYFYCIPLKISLISSATMPAGPATTSLNSLIVALSATSTSNYVPLFCLIVILSFFYSAII